MACIDLSIESCCCCSFFDDQRHRFGGDPLGVDVPVTIYATKDGTVRNCCNRQPLFERSNGTMAASDKKGADLTPGTELIRLRPANVYHLSLMGDLNVLSIETY